MMKYDGGGGQDLGFLYDVIWGGQDLGFLYDVICRLPLRVLVKNRSEKLVFVDFGCSI